MRSLAYISRSAHDHWSGPLEPFVLRFITKKTDSFYQDFAPYRRIPERLDVLVEPAD